MLEQPNITFLQHNVGHSYPNTISLLEIGLEKHADFILVQEPKILPDNHALSHPSYTCLLPEYTGKRPRVAIYVLKTQKNISFSVRTDLCNSSDLLIIDITLEKFEFQLINIYNERELPLDGTLISQASQDREWTLERHLRDISITKPTIFAGDLNCHHSWWNSRILNPIRSQTLIPWLERYSLVLANEPDLITHLGTEHQNGSVIDLTFSNFSDKITNWKLLEESTGSRHEVILFTVTPFLNLNDGNHFICPEQQDHFNFKKANWSEFSKQVIQAYSTNSFLQGPEIQALELDAQKFQEQPLQSNSLCVLNFKRKGLLDKLADEFSAILHKASDSSIPRLRVSLRSKPWWNENIAAARKRLSTLKRQFKQGRATEEEFRNCRTSYFNLIKVAKQEKWDTFLSQAQGKEVFKAFKYTKPRHIERLPPISVTTENGTETGTSFKEKSSLLKKVLFPPPPSLPDVNWQGYQAKAKWQWPKVTPQEVQECLNSCSKKSAPGVDSLSYLILQKAYLSIPELFNKTFLILIAFGYHPERWKIAKGIILKKPKKPDYSNPKAYRVICLLNCLGKLSEKIVANRLQFLAETQDLLHPSQVGGRTQKSAIDAALSLTHEIELNKARGKTTSVLFKDIKGAFDFVSKNRLLQICKKLGLPSCLISWIESFMLDRKIQLAFDGEIENIEKIEVGIPQGSPVSPILFLIYIRSIFKERHGVKFLSYIDDIALICSSKDVKSNVLMLQHTARKIISQGQKCAIAFDKEKMELMHFSSKKEPCTLPLSIFNLIIQPKDTICWLGIYFNRTLNWKEHVQIRVAEATRAFFNLKRLSNTTKGLSFQATRQLYIACITSIADFGIPVWWKDKGQKHLLSLFQKLQNTALRSILGAFKTSPQLAMEMEASLPPPEIRFNKACNSYSLRLVKCSPSHPVRIRQLEKSRFKEPQTQVTRLLKKFETEIVAQTGQLQLFDHCSQLWNTPWKEKCPLSVSISKLDKEKATTEHNSLLQAIKEKQGTIAAYTDGTKQENGNVASGFCLLSSSHEIQKSAIFLGKNTEVFDGELYAILVALRAIRKYYNLVRLSQPIQEVWIFSDSQAAIQRIQSLKIGPGQSLTAKIWKLAKQISQYVRLFLHWVPGHMGIYGNELADKMAQKAAIQQKNENWNQAPGGPPEKNLNVNFSKTSMSTLSRKIREQVPVLWQAKWQQNEKKQGKSYLRSIGPSPQFSTKAAKLKTAKSTFSALFQLKVGHGYFKSYTKRLNQEENNGLCCCGQFQSPSHLLLHCTRFWEERLALKQRLKVDTLSLPLLLHTKNGRAETAQFLLQTQIATRSWILQEGDEGEGA